MADIGPLTMKIIADAKGVEAGMKVARASLESGLATLTGAATEAGNKAAQALLPGIEAKAKAIPQVLRAAFTVGLGELDKALATTSGGTALRWGVGAAAMIAGPVGAVISAIPSLVTGAMDFVTGTIRGAFVALGSTVAWLGGLMEKAFRDPVGALMELADGAGKLAGQVPLIGGLLSLPFEGLSAAGGKVISLYREGADRIRETGAAAARMNIDIGQYNVLSRVLGGGGEGEAALFHLQRSLSEAQFAAAGTRTAFDKLGLSGREMAELFNASPTAAMGRLFDALSAVKDATQRAEIAQAVFGRSAKGIGEAVSKGSAEINRVAGLVDQTGTGMSPQDFATIKQLDRAQKQLSMVREGFVNQLTIAAAPALALLAEKLPQITLSAKGLADTFVDVALKIAQGAAFVIDNWDRFGTEVVPRLKEYWEDFVEFATEKGDELLAALTGRIRQALGGYAEVAKVLELVLGGPGTQIHEALKRLDELDPTVKVKQDAGAKQKAREDARAYWDEYDYWFGEGGTTAAQDAVKKFGEEWKEKLKGAGKGAGAAAGAAAGEAFASALKERMTRLEESLKGPIGQLQDKLTDLKDLQKRAFEDMTTDLAGFKRRLDVTNLAAGRAFEDLMKSYQMPSLNVGAMQAGTKEAYSTILANQPEAHVSVQDQIKMVLDMANQQRKRQIKIGEELLDLERQNKLNLKDL